MTKKNNTNKKVTAIAARGKVIMTEAKKIRKANPRKKWSSCVSEAAKKSKK